VESFARERLHLRREQDVPIVLIIEDDRVAREALAMVLRRKGFEVIAAAGLGEGIPLLASKSPDYLILDLTLSDGLGTSALRYVREQKLATKVAITTGTSRREVLDAVEKLGPDKLFQKPYSVSDLVNWVRQAA
jgi:DNA-binding response OmpR family regulator